MRPGPAVDKAVELEDAVELCWGIANWQVNSAVTSAMGKTY